MKIEHIGYVVKDPTSAAKWYVNNLGFKIARSTGAPTYTHFLYDETGKVMIEIYYNPAVTVPDYSSMNPLLLHLALCADNVAEVRKKLLEAGATAVGDVTITDQGDELAMLRDPWGFPIQLAKRAEPMV